MYPNKITPILQEMFSLNLFIQKLHLTSRRITYIYYYNTEIKIIRGPVCHNIRTTKDFFIASQSKAFKQIAAHLFTVLFLLFHLSCIT